LSDPYRLSLTVATPFAMGWGLCVLVQSATGIITFILFKEGSGMVFFG